MDPTRGLEKGHSQEFLRPPSNVAPPSFILIQYASPAYCVGAINSRGPGVQHSDAPPSGEKSSGA